MSATTSRPRASEDVWASLKSPVARELRGEACELASGRRVAVNGPGSFELLVRSTKVLIERSISVVCVVTHDRKARWLVAREPLRLLLDCGTAPTVECPDSWSSESLKSYLVVQCRMPRRSLVSLLPLTPGRMRAIQLGFVPTLKTLRERCVRRRCVCEARAFALLDMGAFSCLVGCRCTRSLTTTKERRLVPCPLCRAHASMAVA